jgi:acyl-coenzyme A thioesterase PaaI-like protein
MNLANLVNDYLLNLPSPLTMKDRLFLDKILSFKIAFNRPHAIQIKELAQNSCTTYLPYKKTNTNHLGGMHACVLALVGEYSAGLMILRNTGLKDYRIILKELQVEYVKQAKSEVYGEAQIDSEQLSQFKQALNGTEPYQIKLTTTIKDKSDQVLALAHTTWQVKAWKSVSYK